MGPDSLKAECSKEGVSGMEMEVFFDVHSVYSYNAKSRSVVNSPKIRPLFLSKWVLGRTSFRCYNLVIGCEDR